MTTILISSSTPFLALSISIASMTLSGCRSSCEEQRPHQKGLFRLAAEEYPKTLDPRLAKDPTTQTLMGMIYEGLTRIRDDGRTELALAESIESSPDGKNYTIKLREAYWSHGRRIEAEDFAFAWKTALRPDFSSPYPEKLFLLKNGRAAKEGSTFVDVVGVTATNRDTLLVELEKPCPSFMQQLAEPVYYPIDKVWLKTLPFHPSSTPQPIDVPTNGPFRLKEALPHRLLLTKNEDYWDQENVHLETLEWHFLEGTAALELFCTDELDWIGAPLLRLPSLPSPSSRAPSSLSYALRLTPADPITQLALIDLLRPEKLARAIDPTLEAESKPHSLASSWLHVQKLIFNQAAPSFCLLPPIPSEGVASERVGGELLSKIQTQIKRRWKELQLPPFSENCSTTTQTYSLQLELRDSEDLSPPLETLFSLTFPYLGKPRVKGAFINAKGRLELRWASLRRYTLDPTLDP